MNRNDTESEFFLEELSFEDSGSFHLVKGGIVCGVNFVPSVDVSEGAECEIVFQELVFVCGGVCSQHFVLAHVIGVAFAS